ncbi:hypothetical protein F441_02030 [Phytophthora nicotianae CJ01A1]|uniref:Uncharacterized protein n=6 Tax=Phytophthora nicotianae TaxID=4792 RepID=W2QL53_PHYN3|nr:hypothetical protein PPTG_08552 [Phytophthora nicotianae INRA-310]ETI53311.1 hypothetical protein F443_03709 [Phytophthora nicotianae P1569]ETK93155.1 hypothetical protein L915_03601 [Phytophthora nicotianae]ETO81991.1 hypothetical protein F444_03779 [Phytophthora nicotianae P1976]ETP25077.1 hypothetical protein F441_02030 [Phytophthora nicotianae CJ01A1]ETP51111.1 hypothetical protein F442_03684 [Phytophthora nicotianae P10297]
MVALPRYVPRHVRGLLHGGPAQQAPPRSGQGGAREPYCAATVPAGGGGCRVPGTREAHFGEGAPGHEERAWLGGRAVAVPLGPLPGTALGPEEMNREGQMDGEQEANTPSSERTVTRPCQGNALVCSSARGQLFPLSW